LELSLFFFSIVVLSKYNDIVKQEETSKDFGFGRNLQTNVDTHQGNKMTLVKQSDFKPENLN
jgi:hypothetical protein